MPALFLETTPAVTSGITDAMTTAFTSALDVVQSDVMTMISAALPKGLLIMGVLIAIRVGVNFFRGLTG